MLIHKPEHYLAISVSYKYDLWNLLEFIEYHLLVGATHFFICNNDDDPTQSNKVLEHYVKQNIVTNINSANKFKHQSNRQAAAHAFCLNLARNKSRWLALLDMDEFLFPMWHDKVTDVLKHFDDCNSVAFHYTCFGSSGHEFRPFMQTEAYNHRAQDRWTWNRLCKAIGQVSRIGGVAHHHYFDNNMVDEKKNPCGWVKNYSVDMLRVNHYLSRSKEDYVAKMMRGNPIGEKRDWHWFDWADRNEVFDDSMKRYTSNLRSVLIDKEKLLKMSRRQVGLL